MSPKARREESNTIKDKLDKFGYFKQNHKLIGNRERSIKVGWRHGVTGLENADSCNTSVLFKGKSESI